MVDSNVAGPFRYPNSSPDTTCLVARGVQQFLDGFSLFHVNGKQKSAERKQLIRAFRDAPKAIITNARCLTEGIDIPAVDMVAFIDPRRSKVDIAQAAGRAMRKPYGSDKTTGYIVIPLFLELEAEETFEAALERSDFSDAAAVLNAMREQDDDLVDVIQALQMATGRGEAFNPKALKDKVEVLGPAVELDALANSVFAEIIDSIGVSWDEWFGRLEAYKEEFGDCLVPDRFKTADGYGLSSWVNRQRKTRDTMPSMRRQLLEDIGFVWDPRTAAWEAGFQALRAYQCEFGDCLVPATFKTADQFPLGSWVGIQRTYKNTLSLERQRRLEKLGFVWEPLAAAWEAAFAEMKTYRQTHGDCLVPATFETAGGFGLGRWVRKQRPQKETMPAERRQQLDDIGFVWDPHALAWEAGFEELQAYRKAYGDCDVPASFETVDRYKLGGWVRQQRVNRDTLLPERQQRLDNIGFSWKRRSGPERQQVR